MQFLQVSQLNLPSIATQYGILGIMVFLLGYFAWSTYQQTVRKNEKEYRRLIEKNDMLEGEVDRLREEMMKLIVEERDRMSNLVKANTEAINELRRTITDFMLRP
jgi:F0F1-type ATP synthase membrane subunit b/b'